MTRLGLTRLFGLDWTSYKYLTWLSHARLRFSLLHCLPASAPHTCLTPITFPAVSDPATSDPSITTNTATHITVARQQLILICSFLYRQLLCQQRLKSYYGLGRNRRGKLLLRPEPDPLPLPTRLPRSCPVTSAKPLYQPEPAQAKPDALPDCRVHVTEDAECVCHPACATQRCDTLTTAREQCNTTTFKP